MAVRFLILLSACGDSTHGSSRNGKDPGSAPAIKVDSTPVSRLVFNSGGSGCLRSSPILYASDKEWKNFVVIAINQSLWNSLSGEKRTIDLHSPTAGFTVRLERFTERVTLSPYCSDERYNLMPAVWNATLGTLAIQKNGGYIVTVRLRNISFSSPDGKEKIIADSVNLDSIDVGGMIG